MYLLRYLPRIFSRRYRRKHIFRHYRSLYDSNINALLLSKSEAKLQDDINRFYKENKALVQQEVQSKLTNEFIKKCYSLIIMNEQNDYYEAYKEYLQVEDKVEKIKYQRGLVDKTALDVSEVNLQRNTLDMGKNNISFTSTFSYIKSETNINDNTRIILPISIELKEYNLEQLIIQFEKSNSSLVQYLHLKKCYENYLYSNYGSYTLYKQIELKIKDYQLQYDELDHNIRSYVSDAILAYQCALQNMSLAEKKLQIADNNYNIVLVKKDHKKATELDVKKAKYELEAAQVSYYQSIYDIKIWQDILDNHIYGATP